MVISSAHFFCCQYNQNNNFTFSDRPVENNGNKQSTKMKFDKTLPVVSISKVLLPCDKEDAKIKIKSIVDEYNTKQNKTKMKQRNKKYQRPEYEPVEADLIVGLKIDMDIEIYVQAVDNRSKVMRSVISFNSDDPRYMEKRHNVAIFCYCPDHSVYVITTNSAWTLVQNYRDPEFPQRIADRLLTLDGPKDRSNKPLFSDISKIIERRKVGNKSVTDAVLEPHISLNYTARLRDNASIHELECFSKNTKCSPVNVLISYGSIRFLCLIKIDTLPALVEYLHRIYKKEPTRTTENEDETDSTIYKQYLREPESQVKAELDLHLIENLRKSIQESDDGAMENFELMHLKMDEFLDATEFKLKNKELKKSKKNEKNKESEKMKKSEIVIDEVPNLKRAITALRQKHHKMFDGIQNKENDFRKELKNICISFKGRTDEIEQQLLHFLEGITVYNHLYYFRAFKKWYYISEDFYKLIQDAFVLCLKTDLLNSRHKAWLKRPWKEDMHEGPYNDAYMDEENFLVGDRTLTDTKIEIFDLLYHYDGTTYLYHVKEGFNQSTRVAQDQICNAAFVIRNHFSNIDTKILKDFHGNIVKNYAKYNAKNGTNHKVPDIYAKFEDFEKLLSDPKKLVFVYAVRTSLVDISQTRNAMKEDKLNRSLTLERNQKTAIDPSEIETSIRALQIREKKSLAKALGLDPNSEDGEMGNHLFQELIQKKYITQTDSSEKPSVNSSLLLATKENFLISDTSNSIIYDKILRPYRTYFISLTAKLSVLKMKKQIEGPYKFRICEIMGEKTMSPSQPKRKRNSKDFSQTPKRANTQATHDQNTAATFTPSTSTSQALPNA